MVKKISRNNMEEAMKGMALVDFSAKWCGPCNMLAPVIEELSEEMAEQLNFYNVDTDNNEELAFKYKIMSIPALVLLKDGVEADRSIGFLPKAALKEFIEKNI